MKRLLLLILICLFGYSIVQAVPNNPNAAAPNMGSGNNLLLFTENRGQIVDNTGSTRPDILFSANSGGAKIYLSANSIHYQFTKVEHSTGVWKDAPTVQGQKLKAIQSEQAKTTTLRFAVSLAGANPAPRVRKEGQNEYYENFYLPHCPMGITGVHTYSRVVLEDVYPGIDWVVYSNGAGMKYDFIVHPGANPARIKLNVVGADETTITAAGELLMKTSLGEIKEQKPQSYCGGNEVPSSFIHEGNNSIGFSIGSYDVTKALTIDPSVAWSTYFGGSSTDIGMSSSADNAGNVYMAGFVSSTNFPTTTGAAQSTNAGSDDAFLVKFSSSGARQWATYYGGSNSDFGWGVATEPGGNIYLTGFTNSSNFPISTGASQSSIGGNEDAFIVKFNSSGVKQWASFCGGSGSEYTWSCAADASGNVYVSGETGSANFPVTTGAAQTSLDGASDAFLVKFSNSGSKLWSTYYGGSVDEHGWSCAADASGNVYLAGGTTSNDFPVTSGAQQGTKAGVSDAFLVKFNGSGARQWATYYGGTGEDNSYDGACMTDASGNVYMAGHTASTNFPVTTGAAQSTNAGDNDAFVVKFNSSGARQWATYYGGSQGDFTWGATADRNGNVYLTGETWSANLPTTSGAVQNTIGGSSTTSNDAFLVKFNTSGALQWASYYGGAGLEYGYSCSSDTDGFVYISGGTSSTSFPVTSGAAQASIGGGDDAFLAKFDFNNPITLGALPKLGFCKGDTVTISFTNTKAVNAGNVYTAQLSDASGSFASPVNIGSLTSTGSSGTITAVIPVLATSGNGYRIRVTASNPSIIGEDNGANIGIDTPTTPFVSITASATTICAGVADTLNATPTNGGMTPAYQWYKNGAAIANATSAMYIDNALMNGDSLYVKLTTSAACPAKPTALSNKVGITVKPAVVPSVTIAASHSGPVPVGTMLTFTTMANGGGSSPSYQWKLNGTDIPTANASTYAGSAFLNGDRISVVMRSNAECAMPNTDTSNEIQLQIGTTSVSNLSNWNGSMKIYPNPSSGRFSISASWGAESIGKLAVVDIMNALGQPVYHAALVPTQAEWNHDVSLDDSVANGQYMIRVSAGDVRGVGVFSLVR